MPTMSDAVSRIIAELKRLQAELESAERDRDMIAKRLEDAVNDRDYWKFRAFEWKARALPDPACQ